ncbi:MAG: 50S ribosomal protein L18Ae [Candidatus Asgardarchaeia archaeon]|nr:50S ribosomal protein L18a [Candidatus Odinarchaeota archaeon]
MGQVKNYLIKGWYKKDMFRYEFKKQVRALRPDEAKEKVLSLIASNHKVRKNSIRISEIKEIPPEEVTDREIQFFVSG